MNIESIQTFVAKLYTNSDFLTLFKLSPAKAFDLMQLSEVERVFFLSVDLERIEKIHDIVKEKQVRAIESLFPLFSTFFEPLFESFLERFLQLSKNYSSSYEGKLRQAADFHDFCVQKLLLEKEIDPPFLIDLIRFEYLYLFVGSQKIPQIYKWIEKHVSKNIEPQTRLMVHEYVHIEDFHFPILAIIRQLESEGRQDLQWDPEITHLLFVPTDSPYPKLLHVNSQFRRLLPYFNGEAPFEILGPAIAKQESAEALSQLPQALAFFKSNQVLALL